MDEKYKDDDHAEKNANALLQYFKEVMEWFGGVFAEYHSSMKGLDIGFLYNKYHKQKIDKKAIHRKFDTLIGNVENASYTDNGIFKYLFSNRHEDLYKREFTKKMKSIKWIEQGKKCNSCQKELKEKDIIGHHKKPFNKNGPTTVENLEILCKECHKEKHNY